MTEREQLARDIFLAQVDATNTRTTEHVAQRAIEMADEFFDELESRREPETKNVKGRRGDKVTA